MVAKSPATLIPRPRPEQARIAAHAKKQASLQRLFGYNINMSIDQIAAEALRLPARDRAFLAGSLWESLEDPFAAPGRMEDAQAVALALERDRQIEQGQVQAVPHEQLMARLR